MMENMENPRLRRNLYASLVRAEVARVKIGVPLTREEWKVELWLTTMAGFPRLEAQFEETVE